MVRAHVDREDRELLPAAERALDPETRAVVAGEMRERRGGGRRL
jgi:hemerythrin-like domain-containing protein